MMARQQGKKRAFEITGFLCDTVRREADSRVSLIGILDPKMSAHAYPMHMAIGVFLKVTPPLPENTPFTIQLCLDDEVIFSARATAPANTTPQGAPTTLMNLVIDRLILSIPRPGTLTALLLLDDAPPRQFYQIILLQDT